MADPFMQIRTMTLLEFGCPPLPVADGRRGENDEAVIINSHDLVSVFMSQAFRQQDRELNSKRKTQQQEIERGFYDALKNSGENLDDTYSVMAEYTRQYLATYLLPPFSINDIRILPREFISPALSQEIKDYHKALHILHSNNTPPPADPQLAYCIMACKDLILKKTFSDP